MKAFFHDIRRICAFLIGAVLFLSGMFKLIDPVGTGLIVAEYAKFFYLGFGEGFAKVLGFLLAAVEAVTGVALMTGFSRTLTAKVSGVLLAFFTLVSAILLAANPAFDCGCFGEALHLTHGQTLMKNLVLAGLWAVAFLPWRDFGESRRMKKWVFALVSLSAIIYGLLSWRSIPSIDYTPFRPGSELLSSLNRPDRVDSGLLSTYVYEKNGIEGSFTLDQVPDSSWTFVRTETYSRDGMVTENGTPDLSFTDADGAYQDELASVGGVMVVSVYSPERLDTKDWTRISEFVTSASAHGFRPLVLVSGGMKALPGNLDVVQSLALSACTYSADRRALQSLNRSNGGDTYFYDGMLVSKYPLRRLPSDHKLEDLAATDSVEAMLGYSSHGHLNFQGFLLYAFGLILLM